LKTCYASPRPEIDKPLAINQANVAKMCIQMVPFDTMVEKEGFPTQREVCSQNVGLTSSHLAQGEQREDVCQPEVDALGSHGRTRITNFLLTCIVGGCLVQ
jgi:hypothetical protein